MIAIPTYIDRIKAGHIVPGAKWTIVQESPTTTVIDGHWGFGFHVNAKAMALTIEKAKTANVAACTVFRQSHVGRLAAYPLMAIEAGMIGLATADSGRSPKIVAPFGGREARLGTNRSRAVPSDLEARSILTWRRRRSRPARCACRSRAGELIPQGWSSTPRDGPPPIRRSIERAAPCCRSAAARATQGSGLAAMVEVLCGAHGLGLWAWSRPAGTMTDASWRCSTSRVPPFEDSRKRSASCAHISNRRRPSEAHWRTLSGEIEHIREQQRRRDGIEVEDATWDRLKALATDYRLAAELDLK